MSGPLSHEVKMAVSLVGRGSWDEIALSLQLDTNDIREIRESTTSYRLRLCLAIEKWEAKSDATNERLLKACIESGISARAVKKQVDKEPADILKQQKSDREDVQRNIDYLRDKVLTLKDTIDIIDVEWSQGGFGGKRQQTYTLCEYSLRGSTFPVYVQKEWTIPEQLTIDRHLQYGEIEGIFFVLHDKSQQMYQDLIRQSVADKKAHAINGFFKKNLGLDFDWITGWITGEYLRDI